MGSSRYRLDRLHEGGKEGMGENIPSVTSLIGTLFILSILPAQIHALTPSQVFDKVKDSVVVVKTLDAQGKVKSQGSGVLISVGRVATNCHVVEGGISYQVGRGKQLVRATLYAEDGDKDICILDAKGITGKPVQLGKATDLKVGVPVYAVGAPQGLERSLSDGIVAQLRGGPPPLIQTTAAISPGSSGGGLFDGEGRLVGLTTLYVEGGQSLNFAMPVEWIGEIKPGRKSVVEGHSQTEWQKRAFALAELKDWQGMFDWCRRWTKSEPKDFVAWNWLGIAYDGLKRYDDAIEAYRQSLRFFPATHPGDDVVWRHLGQAYSNLKRYDDAIEAYRQSLSILPRFDVWRDLGIAYDGLKRYNEAIEAYRQALRINPDDVDAWYNLGVTYALSGQKGQVMEVYGQLKALNFAKAEEFYKNVNVVVPVQSSAFDEFYKKVSAVMYSKSPVFSEQEKFDCVSMIEQRTAANIANDWSQMDRLAKQYILSCRGAFGANDLSIAFEAIASANFTMAHFSDVLKAANACIETYYANPGCHLYKVQALIALDQLFIARDSFRTAESLIKQSILKNDSDLKNARNQVDQNLFLARRRQYKALLQVADELRKSYFSD